MPLLRQNLDQRAKEKCKADEESHGLLGIRKTKMFILRKKYERFFPTISGVKNPRHSGGGGKKGRNVVFLHPFRAPEPLPRLNPSNFVPQNGVPVVKGLIPPYP